MSTLEHDGLVTAASLMAVAARTAPKTMGQDWLEIIILQGDEKKALVEKSREIAEKKIQALKEKKPDKAEAARFDWYSDAQAVEKADLLLLFGINGRKVANLDCGGCGFATCAELAKAKPFSIEEKDFPGPYCMFRVMDLSIAVTSALCTAMDLRVDNRLMQKVGIAALKCGLFKNSNAALGVPMSASGKNIFFDRIEKAEAAKLHLGRK